MRALRIKLSIEKHARTHKTHACEARSFLSLSLFNVATHQKPHDDDDDDDEVIFTDGNNNVIEDIE